MKKVLRNGSSSLVHWRDYTDDKRKNPYRGIRGGLAPPSWYKIMTGPLGQHNIKTHRNRDCDDFIAPCIGVFCFFVFLKSGQHLRSQTYKWWPIWWLLEEMPSFWWGKGAIPKYPVSVRRTFLFWVCGLCVFFFWSFESLPFLVLWRWSVFLGMQAPTDQLI